MFLSIVITAIVSIIIYYLKFVGGANSKSLITLSLLDSINFNKNIIHLFTPIIVLMNTLITFLIVPNNLYRILNKENICIIYWRTHL
jgi:hypothetical protein